MEDQIPCIHEQSKTSNWYISFTIQAQQYNIIVILHPG